MSYRSRARKSYFFTLMNRKLPSAIVWPESCCGLRNKISTDPASDSLSNKKVNSILKSESQDVDSFKRTRRNSSFKIENANEKFRLRAICQFIVFAQMTVILIDFLIEVRQRMKHVAIYHIQIGSHIGTMPDHGIACWPYRAMSKRDKVDARCSIEIKQVWPFTERVEIMASITGYPPMHRILQVTKASM